MELISIGFLLGVVFSMLVMGAGAVIGSRKKELGLDIKKDSEIWAISPEGVKYSNDGGKSWVMTMDTQGNGIIQREKKDD